MRAVSLALFSHGKINHCENTAQLQVGVRCYDGRSEFMFGMMNKIARQQLFFSRFADVYPIVVCFLNTIKRVFITRAGSSAVVTLALHVEARNQVRERSGVQIPSGPLTGESTHIF